MADVVMGVMANIFYLEKGYSINQIATYSKFFGVFATIAGGLLGGAAGAVLSRDEGRWWAIPLGAVVGSAIGCDAAGG